MHDGVQADGRGSKTGGNDGSVATACPHSGQPLLLTVTKQALVHPPGVVHFAVPARDWWRDIGFT